MNPFATEELAREHYRRLVSVAAATHTARREGRQRRPAWPQLVSAARRRVRRRAAPAEVPVLLCEDC